MQNRRGFLKSSSIATLGLLSLSENLYSINKFPNRKIKISLMPGSVGINVNAYELINLAIKNNFDSIYPLINDLKKMSDLELNDYMGMMKSNSVSFDVCILPVDFSQTNSVFNDGIKVLKDYCNTMKKIESKGFCRWIMPTNNDLTYLKNFETHKSRLKECAKIIGDNGMKLGLEFVAPKTLMARDQFSFIRTINELRELIDAIDENNVGYQLDTFHLYCANHSVDDLRFLNKNDIIMCQLNDAVKGRSQDEQIDLERELPGKTGLINTTPFLNFLEEIGYEGTISAEPFNKDLNNMDNEEAAKVTFNSIKKSFEDAGIF
ncbi:MAG: sugar phosphate isomerase/epimerase [Cryomorphaceae bacterium]|jgi:sugar phosphate isomerase/epimerase|nr:sugar phosphate isomerase/epimerase [Cryomorphaceae bacterium]MBT3503462.1 sugar phosphate isomerase/epimerase [Cryomorphaceae bacterium]MBT3688992.1 sugar phosphate isomerase/epimerase [Cryomorphaceae bacterium]MBT4222355.1 sugar phosphate isomerase/epimerase [Cryomorphaceae bacterium]MBT4293081.1 sugar phosphate isomerase/epimerase [Cryomorphaceae bacterium]|tara:strand:- start:692 stop:1651 length:960 start_codon:yes stop_codon:yes gene_type:complete